MRLAALATPRAGAVERRALRYGAHQRALLDLTLPRDATATTPLVVFFHGGGWEFGSRRDYAFLARAFAAEGVATALPDYRLWPDARWPDFVQDGAAALTWLRTAPDLPRGPVFVMGHSAGGFIAAALALDPRWLDRATLPGGHAALAGAVLVSAPIAWQPTDEPVRSIFAPAPGGRIAAVPEPAALAAAPPLLLIHGTADTVVGAFHSTQLARDIAAARGTAHLHLMDGAGHIAPMVALAEPARRFGWARPDVWEAALAFIRRQAAAP
jgi:acetyl esterase/lipase